jgi:hypothetical protein
MKVKRNLELTFTDNKICQTLDCTRGTIRQGKIELHCKSQVLASETGINVNKYKNN